MSNWGHYFTRLVLLRRISGAVDSITDPSKPIPYWTTGKMPPLLFRKHFRLKSNQSKRTMLHSFNHSTFYFYTSQLLNIHSWRHYVLSSLPCKDDEEEDEQPLKAKEGNSVPCQVPQGAASFLTSLRWLWQFPRDKLGGTVTWEWERKDERRE